MWIADRNRRLSVMGLISGAISFLWYQSGHLVMTIVFAIPPFLVMSFWFSEDIKRYVRRTRIRNEIVELTANLSKTEGLRRPRFQTLSNLRFYFPLDYQILMEHSNGLVGSVGPKKYLNIWSYEQMKQVNERWEKTVPGDGLLYFAAGKEVEFAFQSANGKLLIVAVSKDGSISICANTFLEFLRKIHTTDQQG